MFFKKKQQPASAEKAALGGKPALLPEQKPEVKAEMNKKMQTTAMLPGQIMQKEFRKMDYEVIISQNTAINGNININGCTRIDGVIDGTLAVDSDLFIGESGNIRAAVYAKNATISGQVTGNISCKERLELTSKAKVFGDIKCQTLIIAEGAVFRGKCAGLENAESYEGAEPCE